MADLNYRSSEDSLLSPVIYGNKRLFLTNLRLLGFCEFPLCIQSKIQISLDMFERSNPEAFQAVMYFLFHKLDPNVAAKKFVDCWPVFDRKTEASFRRVCSNWLESIAREDEEAQFPGRVGPLLMFPHGDKFYKFLVEFSTYVMYLNVKVKVSSAFILCRPKNISNDVPLSNFTARNIQTATHLNLQRYAQNLKKQHENYRAWKEALDYQIDLNRKLSEDLKLIRQENKNLKEKLSGRTQNAECKNQTEERINKLSELWKTINVASEADDTCWNILSSIITSKIENLRLDGGKLLVAIPNVILARAKDVGVKREHLENARDGENVNLLNLTRLFAASLKLYEEEIKRNDPFPEIKKISSLLGKHGDKLDEMEDLKVDLHAQKQELLLANEKFGNKVPYSSSMKECNSNTVMDLLHISKPSNQNTADSKIEKDLLDFWTPFQTLEDGVETPLSSNKYLSLPSGRRFSRRCSPLLNDPLKSPVLLRSQSGSYLENSNDIHSPKSAVIETGINQKCQWTKVHLPDNFTSDDLKVPDQSKQNEGPITNFEIFPENNTNGFSENYCCEIEGSEIEGHAYNSTFVSNGDEDILEESTVDPSVSHDECSFDFFNSEGIQDQYLSLVTSTPSPK